jgi:flagellar hook-length control protein FliK
METAKSQFRLRTLDAGGRPAGTGRSPLAPGGGSDFQRSLTQGLEEVQQQEGRARRENGEAVKAQATERQERSARDQQASLNNARERRESDSTRAQERDAARGEDDLRAQRRTGDEQRAEQRRGASNARHRERPQAEQPARTQDGIDESVMASQPAVQQNTPSKLEGGLNSSPAAAPQPGGDGSQLAGQTTGAQTGANPAPAVPATPATQAANPAVAVAAASNRPSPAPVEGGTGLDRVRETQTAATRKPQAAAPAPSTPDLERAEAILRQVRVALQPGLRSATLNLNPAELGRVNIRLRVKDSSVYATVRAESEATLAVLERHLPELRAMFAQQGFEGMEFDLGLASDGDLSSARDGANHQGDRGGRGAQQDEIPLDPIALARPLAAAEGGVDLIA